MIWTCVLGGVGDTARELKAILGVSAQATSDDDESDWEDRLNQVIQSRARQPNLSFFAFTATPKGKTLELFGRIGTSGMPEAFHLYRAAPGGRSVQPDNFIVKPLALSVAQK